MDGFKYQESIIQNYEQCTKEAKKMSQAEWNERRRVSGVICDRKIATKLKKVRFYKTVVSSAMM